MLASSVQIGRPAVAAITFSPRGGGIAAVSRLVRRALGDATGREVDGLALSTNDRRFDTTTLRRVAFGLEVGWAQAMRRCDWVFYTHLNLAAVQTRIPGSCARPYAVFLHDIEAWTPLGAPMQRVLAGAFLRVANSTYTARRVRAANPEAGAVVACPLGLAPSRVPTAATPPAFGPHAVLIVGRMASSDRYKGHDELIEAWPSVVARIPDATLVCVGEGDDVGRLRQKSQDAGVGSSVIFTGFVDEATRAAIYQRAALLAMPSRREGFGLVYIEAMEAGLPCIGSIHDAAPDVIVDGQTGFLVDQADRAALADRIVAVLGDDGLARRLGAAGRARFEQCFTYDAFRERFVATVTNALPALRDDDAHGRRAEEPV